MLISETFYVTLHPEKEEIMSTKKYIIAIVFSTITLPILAQEYHGEMERLYPNKPDKQKEVKQMVAKTTNEPPTTLLPQLQTLAAELLKDKKGSIVALRPKTGEIICLATNSPKGENLSLAIGTAYAPGSTIKVANALVYLQEGIIQPTTKLHCGGAFREGNIKVNCHKHRQPLMLEGAISASCNTYFLKAFKLMIGNKAKYGSYNNALDTWHDYMISMGLGGPLGVDLPDEKGGLIANSAYMARRYKGGWNPLTTIWTGMGQGDLTCTPLQLCNLAATIANRGFFYTPHITRSGKGYTLPQRFLERHNTKIAPKYYEPIIKGMRGVVTSGTAYAINTPDYTICGKTGTVENEGADHSTFIAFAPMNNPQIAIAVFIENGGWGADVAAPIAAKIIKKALTKETKAAVKPRKKSVKTENTTKKKK